jgi:predicted DNA-binding WGR domain protein/uncharacterized protein YwqG
MPRHSIPTDNGKYDFLITITLEGCTVTIQENEGRDGGGASVFHETHEFSSEAEAKAFYQAQCSQDPRYSPPTDEEITLQRGEPVYLEFSDDRSHKFYEVTVRGVEVYIRYGRIGTQGKDYCSVDATAEAALHTAFEKIKDKLKKGYRRSPAPVASPPTQQVQGNLSLDSIPYWLPEDFRVYVSAEGVVGTHGGSGEARILPTVNQYTGEDGGYVAFYSRDPAKAVYSVGGGIYVVGQIRLKGRYIGRIFHPEGYETQDISAAPAFKDLCRRTFAIEGWAGGDTGGWFGSANRSGRTQSGAKNRLPEVMQNFSLSDAIAHSAIQVMSADMQAGEEVLWQASRLRRGIVQIAAVSHSPSFSFNLMAGEEFAYHFNPRSGEAQIVQNTRIGQHWGTEERLPLPPEMAFGREFELAIAVQDAELVLYLNGAFLARYPHRISPTQIDGLRLICAQGSLQIRSVKVSELSDASAIPVSSPDAAEETEADAPELKISQFVRLAWQPIVTEGDSSLLASKFSGRPWLAADESWLTCPCCSQPMLLFVQLNLSELPEPIRQEYGVGLLQVFHCVAEDCDGENASAMATVSYGRSPFLTKNVLMRLIEPQGEAAMPSFPLMNGEHYEKYFPAKTITGWLEQEDYPDLDELVALTEGWDAVRNSNSICWDTVIERLGFADLDELEGDCPEPIGGDKLAGYPHWVQGMEYPGCPICHAPMHQVFQLGSDDNLSYMFGDLGTAHVLQCKTHKDQFAFVWSCG